MALMQRVIFLVTSRLIKVSGVKATVVSGSI